jgi:hypothetical protein
VVKKMSTTIDSLQIEIQSNSTNAAASIKDLEKALKKLNKNGDVSNAVSNLTKLRQSLGSFVNTPSSASKIESLANSLKSLKKVGTIDLGPSLDSVKRSLESLRNVDVDGVAPQIQRIAEALTPLNNVKGSGFNAMMNGLKKLDEVSNGLDTESIDKFVDRIKELDEKLEPVSKKLVAIGNAFKGVNSKALEASGGFSVFGGKVNTTTLNMQNLITIAKDAWSALQPVINLLKNTIGQAIEWEGIAQRFGRGFGAQAEDVYSWVQRLNKEMGINVQQFMQYSSTYATMLTGFGVASKDASKMALGYMELTYDIWAGYNDIYKNFSDAADAVRSAIAGEVEPVRRAGFTIVEATLEETAANHGLEISLEKATEAQKSYLRYLTLVDQAHAQNLVGTYAKEMNTAEGQMRTFAQQLKSLAQTFGSIFLPVLIKVMPWLQAFIDLVGDAIESVAAFFNIDIQRVNFGGSGLKDMEVSASGANEEIKKTEQSLKDLKSATTGIDELNIISPPGESSSSAGAGSGSDGFDGLDIGSLWDESIFDQVQFEADAVKEKVKEALAGITAVVGMFKLAIGTILVVTGANIPLGIGLMALGAVALIAPISINWNSMSDELAKTLTTVTSVLGGFLLAIGAFLAFTGVNVGLGIALMVAGAVSLGTAATINWKFLEGDMKNALSILTGVLSGGLLAIGALFAFTGVGVGLGISLMVAGAVGLAATVGLNWDSMPNKIKKVIADLTVIVSNAAIVIGAMLAFSMANVPLGLALMAAGAVGLGAAAELNWDGTTDKVESTLKTLTNFVSSALLGVGGVLAFSGVNIPLGVALLAAGAIGLCSSAKLNPDGIVNVIKNVLKEIGVAVGASLLALGVLLCLTQVGLPIGIGLIIAGATGLVSGVALNWDAFKDIGKRCVDGIVSGFSDFGNKAKEIFGNFVKAVKDFLGIKSPSKVFAEIGGYCMQGLTNALGVNSLKNRISTMWGNAKSWWDKSKATLASYTPSIGNIKDKLSSAWTTARNWWSKSKAAMAAYTPSIGSIKDKLSSAWNTAKTWWTKNVKLSIPSLSFKVTYTTKGLNAVQKGIVKALGLDGWPKLSFAADGGIFDTGSLVWAGESGPEILASAGGGKTGVMNVQQMSEAVYEGVYSAVVAAMRNSDNSGSTQAVNVYLDGKQIYRSTEQYKKERGATIMGNQVYGY